MLATTCAAAAPSPDRVIRLTFLGWVSMPANYTAWRDIVEADLRVGSCLRRVAWVARAGATIGTAEMDPVANLSPADARDIAYRQASERASARTDDENAAAFRAARDLAWSRMTRRPLPGAR